MKVTVEFLKPYHYRENYWEGEHFVEAGEHKAVRATLAMHLVHSKIASIYDNQATVAAH
ncbi:MULTISPECIES: hypothetical protein [unclassified Vibrio]|uniref:Uncharacterized protein n=1 Tax=Vibrio sp. HB236076 TaxID=3232307 RepID=A0AB39HG95_9VIBR|nr:hypothetical protein [Vibrio sp. HB161653]MDP5253224.1 hypothetical protein [Vibrio sp. HB161653]